MSSHSVSAEIKDPGSLKGIQQIKFVFYVMIAIGAVLFAIGLKIDPTRAWAAYLLNHFFFMALALGGLFFTAIHWVTNSMWSSPVRRIAESFSAYIPVIALTFVGICFGTHDLFHWSHPEFVKGDAILEGKAGYLNIPFFVIRNFVAIAIWWFISRKMVQTSLENDRRPSSVLVGRAVRWSVGFLISFALLFSMASFDQLMSLDPHWFSTMFGVYCFAGAYYATFATVCLLALYLIKTGHLKHIVNENHLHDIGKFMFGFSVFWAYIGFSQYMLIWYANLPEETGYYILRSQGAWQPWSIALFIGKFVVPFLVLLPRPAKRNPKVLTAAAVWMLAFQWIDLMWLIQPQFFKDGSKIGWLEIGVTIGFIGLFLLMIFRFLSKNSVLAIGDPRLEESVHHHHQ